MELRVSWGFWCRVDSVIRLRRHFSSPSWACPGSFATLVVFEPGSVRHRQIRLGSSLSVPLVERDTIMASFPPSNRRATPARVMVVIFSSVLILLAGPVGDAWRMPSIAPGQSTGVAKTSRWAGFLGNFARRSPSISTSPSLPPSLPASSLGPLSAATMAPPSTLSPAAQKKKDAVAAYVKSRG
ncbi:hypothetical protein Naga_101491g2, partial [Nannochloropsis gaditana]